MQRFKAMRLPSFSRYSQVASSMAAATTMASWFLFFETATSCEKPEEHVSNRFQDAPASSRLIFLGTGSSTGCPRPLCTMVFHSTVSNDETETAKRLLAPYCQVSKLAMTRRDSSSSNPRHNKNYRNNPSLLISIMDQKRNRQKNILIDAGKTFREGALRWFPIHNIAGVDAIVLTHHHMDAAAGLDDVRGFQKWQGVGSTSSPPRAVPMPLFLSTHCLSDLQDRFPWLLPRRIRQEGNPAIPLVERHVASFDVHVFEPFRPFVVEDLEVLPLPVMHGEDLVSFGFAFTVESLRVVYLSDISRMLPETLECIKQLGPTDVLVIDALHPTQTNAVHFSLEQAMEVVRSIGPTQTFLVGMNCDSYLPHEETNHNLRAKYGNVLLAYDGQVIEVPPQSVE